MKNKINTGNVKMKNVKKSKTKSLSKTKNPQIWLSDKAYEMLSCDDGRYFFSKQVDRSLLTIHRWLLPKNQHMFARGLIKEKVLQYTGLTQETAFTDKKTNRKNTRNPLNK